MTYAQDAALVWSISQLVCLVTEGDRKFDNYLDEVSPLVGKTFKIGLSGLSYGTFEAACRQGPLRKAAAVFEGSGSTIIGEFRSYFVEYTGDGILLGMARPEKYLKAKLWQSVLLLQEVEDGTIQDLLIRGT